LAGDVTIVSNANYLIWDQLTYVPTFLTAEDRLVIEDRAGELRCLAGLTTLFPFEFRSQLGSATESKIYLNLLRHFPRFPRFSRNIARRVFWGGTVSFLNLQLARYLGCDPVVLVGFDHSYQLPETRTEGSVIHSLTDDVNHIHPNYFGPGYRWHDPRISRMEEAYLCARTVMARDGLRVLNGTVGGHLEVFERIPPIAAEGEHA
jgi:hypothetical protein